MARTRTAPASRARKTKSKAASKKKAAVKTKASSKKKATKKKTAAKKKAATKKKVTAKRKAVTKKTTTKKKAAAKKKAATKKKAAAKQKTATKKKAAAKQKTATKKKAATKKKTATKKKKTGGKAKPAAKKKSAARRKPAAKKKALRKAAVLTPEPPILPMPDVGDPAPDFTLLADDGTEMSLQDLRGKTVVLYFYPKDNTPGCTTEACNFRDVYGELEAKGATVIGMSRDSVKTHAGFKAKQRLNFPLLSDPSGETIAKFGAWGPKVFMGRKFNGILRSTMIIDPEGRIAKVYPKVSVKTHADEVLADLDAMG